MGASKQVSFRKKAPIRILICVLFFLLLLGALFYFGVIHLNNPSRREYPVRGVDVSAYQGEIDWLALSQSISFAFIKATEGSSFVDSCFEYNYEQAHNADILVGVYHFFSFESSGTTQAQHFIRTVGDLDGLPPAVDVEFYKNHSVTTSDKTAVIAQLTSFVSEIQKYYGVAPIIYATEESYAAFISGQFLDCPIWIRNVIGKPKKLDGREFTFWQYSNRHHLSAYTGEEYFIDMNVFNGNESEFLRLASLRPTK
jgi:lysozyme